MENLPEVSYEEKIKYLVEVSKYVTNSPCAKTLMSYYLRPCSNVSINKDSSYLLLRCPHCNIPYQESIQTEYRVKPEKRKCRFQRRLIKKSGDSNMTLYQYKQLKTLKAKKQINSCNSLEICCGTCKHINKRLLPKPKKNNGAIESVTIPELKQKKKKKKDRFSGLNVDAVLSVTPQRTPKHEAKSSVFSTTTKISLVASRDVKQNGTPPNAPKVPFVGSQGAKKKNTPQSTLLNKSSQNSNLSSTKKSKINKNKLKDALKKSSKPTSSAAALKNFLSNF